MLSQFINSYTPSMTRLTSAAKKSFRAIGTGTAISVAYCLGFHENPYPPLLMGVGAMVGIASLLAFYTTETGKQEK